tara:strand:- start:1142 stop:2263 length:1122 start_codon:yes stop_codon:yes gene_type:complete
MELGMPIMPKDNTLAIQKWAEKPLKQIAPLQRGFDLPSSQLTMGPYPVVYSNGIVNYHNKYMVKAPGIVTGRSGTIGKVTYVTQDFWPHNTSLWVTNFHGNDTKFIYYLYLFIGLERFSTGSGVPTLNRNDVHDFRASLPPIHEQKAIAQVLSDTDALIQALEKKITKKKSIKKGVMQKLLTPKEGWVTTPLTEVVDYTHGKAHEKDIVENGKYVVVNSKFISQDGAVVKYSNSNFCKAKSGDILTVLSDLPNGKALAKCFHVTEDDKYAVNQRICIWRPKKGNYPIFLKYLLNRNKYFLALDDGVSQTHILNHHIEKCEISIPADFDEQKKIGTILFDLDKEIAQIEQNLSKFQFAKQGLMQQLLTGKIRLV